MTHPHHCSIVWSTVCFHDKFGSVLKCIGKPKVSAGGGVGMALLPLTPLFLL